LQHEDEGAAVALEEVEVVDLECPVVVVDHISSLTIVTYTCTHEKSTKKCSTTISRISVHYDVIVKINIGQPCTCAIINVQKRIYRKVY
jgi:hypothetical protein